MMSRRPSPIAQLAVLALAAGLVAIARTPAPARPDDDEDRQERREIGRQSFVENCLMCHAEEMASRQRLTPKQWAGEVDKMMGWGSPLPPDRKAPLVEYLAESFPDTQPPPPLVRVGPEQALGPLHQAPPSPLPDADPARGEALFAQHCAACHGPTARGGELGTNLVTNPVLLREGEFRALIKDGRRRMPAFAALIDDSRQADLLAWLRRRGD